jgi:hypothetical protein
MFSSVTPSTSSRMGHELRTKSMFFERVGIEVSTERDLFISLGDVIRQTSCLCTLSPNGWLATPLPVSIWNICSIWLFYNASECSSSHVTFEDKLSRYLINVQRIQFMLMHSRNCAVIKMLLGHITSYIQVSICADLRGCAQPRHTSQNWWM